MSSSVLDIESLLAPIPGENPEGYRVPLTLRQKLEMARKDFEPDPNGANLPPIPKKPDWATIIKLSQETLTQTSKDLEIAIRLVEAITRQQGLVGLRDGMIFLREFISQCWDRMHPIPDVEDGEGMEIRAERFHWIGDAQRGARFPYSLKSLPLVRVKKDPQSPEYRLSINEHEACQKGEGNVSASDLQFGELISPDLPQILEESSQALESLRAVLVEKLEHNAPALAGLSQAIEEVRMFLRHFVKDSAPVESAATSDSSSSSSAASSSTIGMAGGAIASREDAYRQIFEIARILERIEPHSPIPYLLRRAVDLGKMPFSRLIKEMVRDAGHLAELQREYGLPSEDQGSAESE